MERNEAVAELKRLRQALEQNPLNSGNKYIWFAEDSLHEYWRNSNSVRVFYVEETTQGSGDYMIKKRSEYM